MSRSRPAAVLRPVPSDYPVNPRGGPVPSDYPRQPPAAVPRPVPSVYPRRDPVFQPRLQDRTIPFYTAAWLRELLTTNGARVVFLPHSGGHEFGPPHVLAALLSFLASMMLGP